ncbi:MAG TPA: sarcosine oxidase subunit gamma family protein [Friedmanniella sp.]
MAELTLTDVAVAPAELRPASPAQHLAGAFAVAEVTGPRAVGVRELPFLTMVGVRAEPGSGPAERLTTTLGARLPTSCGGVGTSADSSALWLAPDEWLVVSGHDAAELTGSLARALHGEPGSVVDLSANRTTLELTGPSGRDLLEKGCPLDLHPRSFAVGSAYATTLAAVPVVLWRTGERTFRVLVRSSFADHVGRWLVDAMTEYRSPVLP